MLACSPVDEPNDIEKYCSDASISCSSDGSNPEEKLEYDTEKEPGPIPEPSVERATTTEYEPATIEEPTTMMDSSVEHEPTGIEEPIVRKDAGDAEGSTDSEPVPESPDPTEQTRPEPPYEGKPQHNKRTFVLSQTFGNSKDTTACVSLGDVNGDNALDIVPQRFLLQSFA